MMRAFLWSTAVAALVAGMTPAGAQQTLPVTAAKISAPSAFIGFEPGADYKLATYTQISAWLRQIATESERIKLVSIGKTAEGREQWMAIVSSPDNLAKLDRYKEIAKTLALGKGLDDAGARALAAEGKAMVWIDAGLHANEVVPAQAHIQILAEMLTRNDAETLRILNDDITLFPFANPDGLELVANWYMRNEDPKKRSTDQLPVLYEKYAGHDDNRDSYMSNLPEITNINRASYRDYYPQIIYNEHQTGPIGTVVFIPPFRDPYNYNNEPLVINQTDALAYQMHGRLIAEGKPGSTMRSGAPYSTWFNGGVRTVGYFHNVIGILTEIIGNPTPTEIPLVPRNQLAREDLAAPVAPQTWHFQQSIDYMKSLDRSVMDWASRNRETMLFNRYRMAKNQIDRGSKDDWIVTPKRIEALEAAAKAAGALRPASVGMGGGDAVTIDPKFYASVLHDPAKRAPRAWIMAPGAQADLPTTVRFVNALIKLGVEVQRADAPFAFDGKDYSAGTYVVRADQAFRPHVLDMFEPQDHPQDFAYPGGPPLRPYDVTGYNLSYQMNIAVDRALDGAPPEMPVLAGEIAPPSGQIIGTGKAGWLVSHATTNSFILTNRLMKAKLPVQWLKAPTEIGGQTLAPGALWIPANAKSAPIVAAAVKGLGIDAYAAEAKPSGETIALKPVRIGLVDRYGGSMASGWTRWIFDQYEFPYTKVFPQEIDAGGLNAKYDVLVFQGDTLGAARNQPKPEDIPGEYRAMLGAITPEKSYPAVKAFAEAGGAVVAVGNATEMGEKLGLPIENALTSVDKDGKRVPLPGTKYYVPGAILAAKVDVSDPLAYGMPANTDVFYYNNPAFALKAGDPSVHRVAWYEGADVLRSGWAWGQKALDGTTAIVDASLGKGHVFLLAPEVTQRGQPHATFKFLFNAVYYGGVK